MSEHVLFVLASLLSKGYEIRTTRLTEDFDFAAYKAHYPKPAVPLFALDPKSRLHIFTPDGKLEPLPEWSIIGLLPAIPIEKAAEKHEAGRQQGDKDPGSAGSP